jgi:hypothetical protein
MPSLHAGLHVPADDGVELCADVFRPAQPARVPAVLLRTPYGRHQHVDEGMGWAEHGFAFVVQDVRGRYDSGGHWRPYAHEREDGWASVAWLREQPWCDGRVVLVGGSYAAHTALQAAAAPGVAGLIASVPALGLRETVFARGGLIKLESHAWWWTTYGGCRTERGAWFRALRQCDPALLATLPLRALPARLGVEPKAWLAPLEAGPEHVVGHDAEDLGALPIPVFSVGGWHDAFVAQSLRLHAQAGMARRPRPPRALLVGPWGHELRTRATHLDGRRTGPNARLSLGARQVAWLDAVLAGQAAHDDVQFYLEGGDRWLNGTTPSRPPALRLYPHVDGQLDWEPGPVGERHFRSDPNDPFPSQVLPRDVSASAKRADVLCFETAPLTRPLAFCGTPRLELVAASSACDCDWVARLAEVDTRGRALHLTYGIATARADGAAWAGRLALDLRPLALRLPVGHRLRLELAGSYFPAYARNPQTGASRLDACELAPATHSVALGGSTCLELPALTDELED